MHFLNHVSVFALAVISPVIASATLKTTTVTATKSVISSSKIVAIAISKTTTQKATKSISSVTSATTAAHTAPIVVQSYDGDGVVAAVYASSVWEINIGLYDPDTQQSAYCNFQWPGKATSDLVRQLLRTGRTKVYDSKTFTGPMRPNHFRNPHRELRCSKNSTKQEASDSCRRRAATPIQRVSPAQSTYQLRLVHRRQCS